MNAVKNAVKAANSAGEAVSASSYWIIPVILLVVVVCLTGIVMNKRETATDANNDVKLKQQTAIFEVNFTKEYKDKLSLLDAIREQKVADNENCLINFQPLTVIYPGYLGPKVNGVFDEKLGVTTALRMGARCLVLPIDYHEKDTMAKPFPPAFTPCLLYRDEAGNIRSNNAGDIGTIAQTIADVAWSDMVTQKNDPLILVLYFVKTPAENTREYLDYMSKVAVKLAPLSSYLLGQTPDGVYNRQGRQDQLMYVNTNQFDKKLILMCNADTSGFRTSQRDFNHTYLTKEDLDFWVNMRIYKQNSETPLGATSIAGRSNTPKAMIDKTNYYTTLPTDAATKRTAIDGTKEKFTLTVSSSGTNPDATTVMTLLDTYGVQSIPLFLIEYSPDNQTLLSTWKYAWRAKPKAVRYVRPAAIQTQQQSQSVNANGGTVTIPS